MSMQMDAEFQKEQNGTLFVWVGALGGGYWGGGGSRAPKPKSRVDVQYFFFWRLLPPPPEIMGHFYETLNIPAESSETSRPVDLHPFWANWVRGGSVEMSKSQRHTRLGAGRGVSQAKEAAIYQLRCRFRCNRSSRRKRASVCHPMHITLIFWWGSISHKSTVIKGSSITTLQQLQRVQPTPEGRCGERIPWKMVQDLVH